MHYNAALAITEAICGTSQTKLYVKLGLESLKARLWFRRMLYFHKFKSYGLPPYLLQLIPQESSSYNTKNSEDISKYHCRQDSFKNSFFPWIIREWNNLDLDIHKSTYWVSRQHLLKVIRQQPSATFNVCTFAGLHLLTRLLLDPSHLNEYRFNLNFQNCIKPLCTCSLEVESTSHFLLYSFYCDDFHATLLNELKLVDEKILKLSDNKLINLLLYDHPQFDSNKRTRLVNAGFKYIIDAGRFTVPLV